MDDSISRQAAIKAACQGFCHPGIFCPDAGCKQLDPIKNIPAENRWIPCSERLPSVDEEYWAVLCCDSHGDQIIGCPEKCEASETGYVAWNEDGKWMRNCVAWMPKPRPYKGE